MSSHFVGKPSPAAAPCPQASMLGSTTTQPWHWEILGGRLRDKWAATRLCTEVLKDGTVPHSMICSQPGVRWEPWKLASTQNSFHWLLKNFALSNFWNKSSNYPGLLVYAPVHVYPEHENTNTPLISEVKIFTAASLCTTY